MPFLIVLFSMTKIIPLWESVIFLQNGGFCPVKKTSFTQGLFTNVSSQLHTTVSHIMSNEGFKYLLREKGDPKKSPFCCNNIGKSRRIIILRAKPKCTIKSSGVGRIGYLSQLVDQKTNVLFQKVFLPYFYLLRLLGIRNPHLTCVITLQVGKLP